MTQKIKSRIEQFNRAFNTNLILGQAYGGHRIEVPVNDQGGIRSLTGYVSKKELNIFLDGMEAAMQIKTAQVIV